MLALALFALVSFVTALAALRAADDAKRTADAAHARADAALDTAATELSGHSVRIAILEADIEWLAKRKPQ